MTDYERPSEEVWQERVERLRGELANAKSFERSWKYRAEQAEARLAKVIEAAREVIRSCGEDWGTTPPTITSLADLRAVLAAAQPEEPKP